MFQAGSYLQASPLTAPPGLSHPTCFSLILSLVFPNLDRTPCSELQGLCSSLITALGSLDMVSVYLYVLVDGEVHGDRTTCSRDICQLHA